MADAAKQLQISGGNILTEFKNVIFFIKRRRTVAFAYGFVFVFIACSAFIAFNPSYSYNNSSSSSSSSSSYPWFSGIFSNSENTPGNNGSQFSSSLYSYFFPNSTSSENTTTDRTPNETVEKNRVKIRASSLAPAPAPAVSVKVGNLTDNRVEKQSKIQPETSDSPNSSTRKVDIVKKNTTQDSTKLPAASEKVGNFTDTGVEKQSKIQPETSESPNSGSKKVDTVKQNTTDDPPKLPTSAEAGTDVIKTDLKSNYTSSLLKKETSTTTISKIETLSKCNMFDGNWIKDESYPLYKPDSCSLIDEQFNCVANGRPDGDYMKMKWKPKQCSLPKLNAKHMLELLKGKRLVYVGDSLNRNMWESLICILKSSVKNQKNVYEASGRHQFRAEASYSFIFKDYNFSVEFFVSPFLVREWEFVRKNGGVKKETLRLDLIGETADGYKDADIIIFNTGHWWTHDKTSKGEDYYQEGSHVYHELNVLEAFRKALTTWARWVDLNIDPTKTHVFFRGYSASHFSGGQWNSGGACDSETEPIKNETYLTPYPSKMAVLEKVIRGMKTPVSYLNITRMTDFRKDGHPSIFRKKHVTADEQKTPLKYQDCSHWCLPGVPDTWNEILYAQLLVKDYERRLEEKIR